MKRTKIVYCETCKKHCVAEGCTAGYGKGINGKKYCFACIGKMDRQTMRKDGNSKALPLYLKIDTDTHHCKQFVGSVSNWPGTLSFYCSGKVGAHNIAGRRYDIWFRFEGSTWHGVQYGDWTQIVHCKRNTAEVSKRRSKQQ